MIFKSVFKNHTQALFEKQGLINYPYFLTEENDGSQPKLVYLLGHRDRGQFDQAFDNFRNDPDWIKARDASEGKWKNRRASGCGLFKSTSFFSNEMIFGGW